MQSISWCHASFRENITSHHQKWHFIARCQAKFRIHLAMVTEVTPVGTSAQSKVKGWRTTWPQNQLPGLQYVGWFCRCLFETLYMRSASGNKENRCCLVVPSTATRCVWSVSSLSKNPTSKLHQATLQMCAVGIEDLEHRLLDSSEILHLCTEVKWRKQIAGWHPYHRWSSAIDPALDDIWWLKNGKAHDPHFTATCTLRCKS